MNERLQHLAAEADCVIDGMGYGEGNLEKFAELIIRECARTASHFSIENKRIHPDIDPRNMPSANHMVYHSTCQSVAEEIREHFGIN